MTNGFSFGKQVRQLRRDHGLTQEELAQQVPCSVDLVRKIEHDARHPSARVALRLGAIFNVPPQERAAFLRLARGDQPPTQQPALLATTSASLSNVPAPVTALLGRDTEAQLVADALTRGDVRLVTLTGTGGVGKTQLALHVARLLQGHFPDGVWVIELAPVRDTIQVIGAIARVLDVPESGFQDALTRLVDVLRPHTLLLLLDNFEHLLASTHLLSELLQACPKLKVLTTSRVRLNVYGETEICVAPLQVPDNALDAVEELASVQLFVARARAAKPDFALTAANTPTVAAVCRQLGGVPLALELAATQMRHTTLTALVAQLKRTLPVLTDGPRDRPERLQSMRAAIAWSYGLLPPELQLLFRQLGAFVGGWTLDAVRAICMPADATPAATAAALTTLLDHHLIQLDVALATEPRYTMLEVIREYALEALQQQSEDHGVRARHATYYAALAARTEPQLWQAEQLDALALLAVEQSNLHAVLGWYLEDAGERADGVRLAINLAWRWWLQNQCHEGMAWLVRAMPHLALVTLQEQVRLLWMASSLAISTGEYHKGQAWAHEAHIIAAAAGDPWSIAPATTMCGLYAIIHGNIAQGRTQLARAIIVAQASGQYWLMVCAYWNLAATSLQEAQNIMDVDAVLQLAELLGERWNIAGVRMIKGWCLYQTGDLPGASAILEAAVETIEQTSDWRMRGLVLRSLGRCRAAQGALVQAVAVYDAATHLFDLSGDQNFNALVVYDIAHARLLQEDIVAARVGFQAAFAHFQTVGYSNGMIMCVAGLAATHPSAEQAVQVLSVIAPNYAAHVPFPDPFVKQDYEHALARSRARLSPEAWEQAWRAGRQLSLEQAVALALSEGAGATVQSSSSFVSTTA